MNNITKTSISILLTLVFAPSMATTSLSAQQQLLERYEQLYETQLEVLDDLSDEKIGLDYKLANAEKDLAIAEQELAAANQQLETARAEMKANPGTDAERTVNLAQHSANMSDQGVRTRQKRLQRLQENAAELAASIAEQQAKKTSQEDRLKKQQELIALRVKQLEKESEQRRLDDAVTAVAAKPVERITVAAPAVKPSVATAPPASTVSPVSPVSNTVAVNVASSEATNSADDKLSTQKLSELDKEELDLIREEMNKLNKRVKDSGGKGDTFDNVYLEITGSDAVKFEGLGGDQYRAEAKVTQGKLVFEVRSKKYRRTIPASDDGQTYVFIYDANRLSRPRLVLFKKSLLDHIN